MEKIKDIKTLDDLTPDAENFNRHTEFGQKLLEDSLRKFGAGRSILVDKDGNIIAGNSTTETAAAIGMEDVIVVPTDGKKLVVVQRTDLKLDSPEGRELALADNMTALKGIDLDLAKVQDTLGEDLAKAWGMEIPEVQRKAQEDDFDPDSVTDTVCKKGDVWLLGRHRLMCGDSTDAGSVALLMAGEKADMVFTDPPYNVAGESKNFAADAPVPKIYKKLSESEWDRDFDIHPALDRIEEALAKDATVYVCTSHFLASDIWVWMKDWAEHYSYCVWSKPNPMPSLAMRHWTWNSELICYATRGRHVFNFPQGHHAPSVWEIPVVHGKSGHPTEKPVAVPEHAILHSSAEGQTVLDLFGGSGTTLIAAEQLNRKCYMMELDPHYCDVIIARWEKLTGNKAERISNGND